MGDGDDDLVFVKNSSLKNIKKAFIDKNYELCRDMCRELLSYGDDDEVSLIMTEASFALAEAELLKGKLHRCKKLLDDAIEYSKKTIYNTELIICCVKNLFFHLKSISPSLDSDYIDCQSSDTTTKEISRANALCRYLNDLKILAEDNGVECKDTISDTSDLYKTHVCAAIHIKNKEYEKALDLLYSIINYKGIPPLFIVYLVSGDIELCAKEIGDYKTAYEYSVNRISILEAMLSEV